MGPGVVGTCTHTMVAFHLYTYYGSLDLLVLKVILVSLGALVSKWPVTRKWLAIKRNGVKFLTRV